MTDDTTNDKKGKLAKGLRNELTEAEALERDLDRLFESLKPPYGAQDRLMARLEQPKAFTEQDLILDGGVIEGPYSFEQALADQQAADEVKGNDLLAAGLEEEPIEEKKHDSVQPDDEDGNS